MHTVADLSGIFVFAVTGALVAVGKKSDVSGIAALAEITALGGGFFRYLVIGDIPPAAFRDMGYFFTPLVAAAVVFFPHPAINRIGGAVQVFDAAGLGMFCTGCRHCATVGAAPSPGRARLLPLPGRPAGQRTRRLTRMGYASRATGVVLPRFPVAIPAETKPGGPRSPVLPGFPHVFVRPAAVPTYVVLLAYVVTPREAEPLHLRRHRGRRADPGPVLDDQPRCGGGGAAGRRRVRPGRGPRGAHLLP
ncbi:trimeric intracellular cation channel family protein [Streptomyces sp. NPDC059909]|uniref:trimeric intracellular cation channel family protein n=1 Tax=Streptomyces sp. NPDC059909 TaxID=3346998 RepID=UPI0036617383